MKKSVQNLDFIEKYNHWLIISGYSSSRKIARIKNIIKKRGNCYFASGISSEIMFFSYRAVKKLNLTGTNFFFSKGAVKKGRLSLLTACKAEKIPWDIGISVKIPARLKVSAVRIFKIENKLYELRVMEILILGTLLKIRYPHKLQKWYSEISVLILAKGWIILENTGLPDVFLVK
ncbi:MAG: hypothetical protein JW982_06115 [Spirochaetes bacterium]|nr:hypothetical protein [Spirochaetota bacterium]